MGEQVEVSLPAVYGEETDKMLCGKDDWFWRKCKPGVKTALLSESPNSSGSGFFSSVEGGFFLNQVSYDDKIHKTSPAQ